MIPRFYPILDTSVLEARGCKPVTAAAALLRAGAGIVQYRHKGDWRQEHFEEARTIRDLCNGHEALFILNDRADFARLLECGLHVGQEDLTPEAARKVVPRGALIGYSTHNAAQMTNSETHDADYLSIGPIFATRSKANPDPVVGLDAIAGIRRLTSKSLVAIGGITLDTAADVLASGADSVAAISAILPEECTADRLQQLADRWLSVTEATRR